MRAREPRRRPAPRSMSARYRDLSRALRVVRHAHVHAPATSVGTSPAELPSSPRPIVGRRSIRCVALRGYGMSFARWRQRLSDWRGGCREAAGFTYVISCRGLPEVSLLALDAGGFDHLGGLVDLRAHKILEFGGGHRHRLRTAVWGSRLFTR